MQQIFSFKARVGRRSQGKGGDARKKTPRPTLQDPSRELTMKTKPQEVRGALCKHRGFYVKLGWSLIVLTKT